MAATIDVLRTLVHKEDARRWAAVNDFPVTEQDGTLIIDEYVLSFDEDGRLAGVEPRVPAGKPL